MYYLHIFSMSTSQYVYVASYFIHKPF